MADFRLQGICQSQFTEIAAERAKVAAEEYFKSGNIDRAIQQGFAALDLNPNLRIVQKYIAAYLIHKFASMLSLCQKMKVDDTKVLYSILFIEDCSAVVDAATIRKHYKEVVLLVHPDKNDSVAADGAFKIMFPNDVYLGDIIDAAKSFRHTFKYLERDETMVAHLSMFQILRKSLVEISPGSDPGTIYISTPVEKCNESMRANAIGSCVVLNHGGGCAVQDFRQQGTKMRRKMWLQNMKIKLIVLGILIALILIIVLSVCHGFKC
ncbi:hypothetical protein POUND7_019481 [Theobroma cacao]